MKSAAQLLRSKPDQTVYSVTPSASVLDAVKLMAEKNVGALLVVEDSKIVGMFTERDYARKIALMGRTSKEAAVRDIMTSPVLYVRPQHTNEECMALMTDNRVRHLPVMDSDRLLGVISIGDVLREVIHEQKFMLSQLEHYITGSGKQ